MGVGCGVEELHVAVEGVRRVIPCVGSWLVLACKCLKRNEDRPPGLPFG